ncbi:MAG: SDR family oxidoreductase [Bacteroidia bacterium]
MTVLISGATKGIGRAIALACASKGYDLALGARNSNELIALKKELQIQNPKIKISAFSVDFTNCSQISEFVNLVLKEHPKIDVLINNVGSYKEDNVATSNYFLEEMLDINLKSAYYLTKSLLPHFKSGDCIINICSILSKNVRKGAVSYTISKHALYGFNNALREELREKKIKVTAIIPGSVSTASWDGIPVNREELIQPEDIAKAAIFAINCSPNTVIEEIIIRPINFDNI